MQDPIPSLGNAYDELSTILMVSLIGVGEGSVQCKLKCAGKSLEPMWLSDLARGGIHGSRRLRAHSSSGLALSGLAMSSVTVELRNIGGTEAALGLAGSHRRCRPSGRPRGWSGVSASTTGHH